jgi:pyridoxine 4-dehydrogenase
LRTLEKAMSDSVSQPSALFRVGGDLEIHRLGFGAMRITGKGVWGPPPDREAALRLLRRVPELGVDFIDTADSYGPDVSEQLICEALHPYEGLVIATKGGLTRGGPDQWTPDGRPDYLIAQARKSLRKLGVERIDLWQLHRIDPKVPRDEQFGAIRQMLDEGLVRHAGLSEVGVEDIEAARKVFPVATVQNRYNLADRASEHVLEHCERLGIGFIPWYPLAAGSLARPGSVLDAVARHHGASGGQIALAWLLRRSPVMLPIPGTGSIEHLEQNTGAATIRLSDEDFAAIERAAR